MWASESNVDAPFFVSHGGVVAAAYAAWAQERPLTVRPDDVWTTLVQQIGWHVNKHAEAFRDVFVEHTGKQKAGLTYDVVTPWPTVVADFVSLLQRRVKPGVLPRFLPAPPSHLETSSLERKRRPEGAT